CRHFAELGPGQARGQGCGIGLLRVFPDHSGDLHALAVTQYGQLHCFPDPQQADTVADVGRVPDRLTVDGDDHVAHLQAGFLGSRVWGDLGNDHAFLDVDPEGVGQGRGEVLHRDAQHAAPHFAILDELIHHLARHVGRNGEADADVAAGRSEDGGVDADQLPAEVDQRAARVAGVDGGIGLDEVLVALRSEEHTSELQSRENLVCRLLLEKKKTKTYSHYIT